MDSKLFWIIRQSLRKVWVRAVSFALFAVITVGIAPFLERYVPTAFAAGLANIPVDKILTILASSMLAVTTFSLSIAVSALTAAASNATPRATALLQEDSTTQNVLATFLGAFLFSLVGLIAVRTPFYDRSAQIFLFLATLVVVALVVTALLRWISHLLTFGRMNDTLDRVEEAAVRALKRRLANPYLGGKPLHQAIPGDAVPIASVHTGYVQHIDVNALAEFAQEFDAEIYLAALPGSFVHQAAQILRIHGSAPSDDQADRLRRAFTLGNERTFDQDPRFGLIVLSEIASRALSPAVNDPGTAISVIGRLVRVLSCRVERADPAVDYPAVHVPPVLPADMIYDAFRPIARDGAAVIEVQMRLHKALDALQRIAPVAFGETAAELSAYALESTAEAGANAADLGALKAVAVLSGQTLRLEGGNQPPGH
ncbi:MAG: DUF2254 domain-containing protein [Gammaproteobacteria bacterium]|nr:DUF2254 domain-containing protein [Gammaproteobacteria bacterium]